jgi:hypothetical protein
MKSEDNLDYVPIEHEAWWSQHAKYCSFNRQGIDIVCAQFHHPNPIGDVLFVTGWSETFLKYPGIAIEENIL